MLLTKVLITAGGTIERIDAVRSIHNTASGKLASIIADELINMQYDITYVHAKGAILPKHKCKTIEIIGVKDLEKEISILLKENDFDLIIHSMAVSDFYLKKISQNNRSLDIGQGKISSDYPVDLHLVPAPKVINIFKQESDACLFGFKLLSNASDEELFAAAYRQIETAGSDFVIANYKEKVSSVNHEAYLISQDGVLETYKTKEEIAKGIINAYLRKKEL